MLRNTILSLFPKSWTCARIIASPLPHCLARPEPRNLLSSCSPRIPSCCLVIAPVFLSTTQFPSFLTPCLHNRYFDRSLYFSPSVNYRSRQLSSPLYVSAAPHLNDYPDFELDPQPIIASATPRFNLHSLHPSKLNVEKQTRNKLKTHRTCVVLSGPGAACALGVSPRAAASFGGSAERIVVSLAWQYSFRCSKGA